MTARLIVMDIDSTLINQEVIDLLGEEAGVGEQVAQITERAMRGELDFKQALEERVGLLAGLDESVFERAFERVTFTPGALELVRSAHSKGWKVGVVSGGSSPTGPQKDSCPPRASIFAWPTAWRSWTASLPVSWLPRL